MMVWMFLTILSPESTLPSFCWPYEIQDEDVTMMVLTVVAVS